MLVRVLSSTVPNWRRWGKFCAFLQHFIPFTYFSNVGGDKPCSCVYCSCTLDEVSTIYLYTYLVVALLDG